MDKTEHTADLPYLFERAKALGAFEVVVDGQIVALPDGKKLESLKALTDQFRLNPQRRTGVQRIDRADSFANWMNRHKDKQSVLFCEANRQTPRLVGIVDYHESGAVEGVADHLARWRQFGAVYPLKLDPRWQAWRAADGKSFTQAEFAAFIEDHALDLVAFAPTAAAATDRLLALPSDVQDFLNLTGGRCGTPEDVMLLARGLDVAVEATSVERVRLESGEVKLAFEEKHKTSVAVPSVFLIGVPVFELSGEAYRLPVRLRYRIDQGKTFWTPVLWRADETFDQAVIDKAEAARTATDLALFYGEGMFG